MGNSFTVKAIINFCVHIFNLEFPKEQAAGLRVKNPSREKVIGFLSRILGGPRVF